MHGMHTSYFLAMNLTSVRIDFISSQLTSVELRIIFLEALTNSSRSSRVYVGNGMDDAEGLGNDDGYTYLQLSRQLLLILLLSQRQMLVISTYRGPVKRSF